MRAFHNDQKIKDLYLARLMAHQQADEIIKGEYWENGKGCAIGCTIHSDDHKKYETELGIPSWLARLEDRIFEGLPNERAKQFPREFLEAISPGQDLDKIKIPMLIFIVETARNSFDHDRFPKVLLAIDAVLLELKRDVLDLDKLILASSSAAYADADDAATEAYAAAIDAASAASAASAYVDAYATHAAASASASAAYAAGADTAYATAAATEVTHAASIGAATYAAYIIATARETSFVSFADKLLGLINGL